MATRLAPLQRLGLVFLCLQVLLHRSKSSRGCRSVTRGTMTYETWAANSQTSLPPAKSTVFISQMSKTPPRWVHGHLTVVRDPLRTLSVLEPGGPGGCEEGRVSTVEETASAGECVYAQNAGFFNTSVQCLGNVVSDGRLVRDSGGVQNAQFGIRRDGTLVFGYLSQEDVLDRDNPFVQLVSGVMWVLRNGEVYLNQSLEAECDRLVDQKVFRDFVDVLSARTVVGHDVHGNLVLFHVDGRTEKRGMSLWEVAEFLQQNGVINAINLDGGGSSSVVINGTLVSYPTDRCKQDSRWRCARAVSTVLCVHQRRCSPSDCSRHGDCVNGRCLCHDGWRGDDCSSLRCQPGDCGAHGVCAAGGCVCAAGWRGHTCEEECRPGFYGYGCRHTCVCLNGAACHHVSGQCTCPPGFHGNFCEKVCPPGFFGPACAERCRCADQCPCEPQTGSCSSDNHGRLTQAGTCLVKQMLRLQKQQEAQRNKHYLPEWIWMLLTLLLSCWPALLLLRRLCLLLRRTRRHRCFLLSDSYVHVPLSPWQLTVNYSQMTNHHHHHHHHRQNQHHQNQNRLQESGRKTLRLKEKQETDESSSRFM